VKRYTEVISRDQRIVFPDHLGDWIDDENALRIPSCDFHERSELGQPRPRTGWMSFAGIRQSGQGAGGIPHSMRDMRKQKMIVIHSKQL